MEADEHSAIEEFLNGKAGRKLLNSKFFQLLHNAAPFEIEWSFIDSGEDKKTFKLGLVSKKSKKSVTITLDTNVVLSWVNSR